MAATTPRTMPRHLKATYLADQEFLLEETRATALYYFPGVVLWLVIFLSLTVITAATLYGWPGQITGYSNALSSLASGLHVSAHTVETYVLYFFQILDLIGFLFLLIRYLRWISTVYAVTSRRVIVQKGILGRDFDEIPVLQVRGVDVHQGVGQRLLGFGTVRVSSEGGTRVGNEDWEGIPHPFKFQKLIEDAVTNLQPTGPVQWATPPAPNR